MIKENYIYIYVYVCVCVCVCMYVCVYMASWQIGSKKCIFVKKIYVYIYLCSVKPDLWENIKGH